MEFVVATSVGALTAAGIYLILRLRTFPVVVGMAMLSYAVNVFLFASGRLAIDLPPIIEKSAIRSSRVDASPPARRPGRGSGR